jgi:hypothetical protein
MLLWKNDAVEEVPCGRMTLWKNEAVEDDALRE